MIQHPKFPHNGFLCCKQYKQLMLNKSDILFAAMIESFFLFWIYFEGGGWQKSVILVLLMGLKC